MSRGEGKLILLPLHRGGRDLYFRGATPVYACMFSPYCPKSGGSPSKYKARAVFALQTNKKILLKKMNRLDTMIRVRIDKSNIIEFYKKIN